MYRRFSFLLDLMLIGCLMLATSQAVLLVEYFFRRDKVVSVFFGEEEGGKLPEKCRYWYLDRLRPQPRGSCCLN